MELLSLMKWPLIASLILPWLLVYLGLHIVQRGVIFVDLALAQTAAFGTCISLLAGYDVHDWQSYAFSLGLHLRRRGGVDLHARPQPARAAGSPDRHRLCRRGGGRHSRPEQKRRRQ